MEPIMILLLLLPAMAQSTTTFDVPDDVGITPDNPLYFLDTAIDNIRLALASSDSEKAKIGLEIAEERLVEVKTMINQNKVSDAEKAEKEHEIILNEVTKVVLKQESESTEQAIEKELENVVDVEQRLKVHKLDVDSVKEKVKLRLLINREKLSENEKLDLERVTSGLDTAISRIDAKISDEKTRIKIRFAEDFQKSTIDVNKKITEFQKDSDSRIKIELSNSGKGSFSSSGSSGSSNSGSGSSGSSSSSRSGSNSGQG